MLMSLMMMVKSSKGEDGNDDEYHDAAYVNDNDNGTVLIWITEYKPFLYRVHNYEFKSVVNSSNSFYYHNHLSVHVIRFAFISDVNYCCKFCFR